MHIKFLLAAGAVLASVGVAQAQDRGAAGILTPWQDRAVDSSFDGEDAVSYRLRQDVQSNVTPVQANVTAKDSRAAEILTPWQDREVDSSFDGEDVVSSRLRQSVASNFTFPVQSNVTSKVSRADSRILTPWEDREVDSSFDGNGND